MLEHALSDKQNVIDRLDAALDQFHTTASRELQSVSHEQISREEALRRALRESQLQHEESKEELLRYKETATKTQNELMFELTELRRIFADKDSQFSLERNRLQDEVSPWSAYSFFNLLFTFFFFFFLNISFSKIVLCFFHGIISCSSFTFFVLLFAVHFYPPILHYSQSDSQSWTGIGKRTSVVVRRKKYFIF